MTIIAEPIVELMKDEFVQEKVEEAAKFFYTNDTVTTNSSLEQEVCPRPRLMFMKRMESETTSYDWSTDSESLRYRSQRFDLLFISSLTINAK